MYLKYFGLQQDPFLLTPATTLYCKISQYEQALQAIQFALQQRDGFFLVTADIGLGKTLLARRLLNLLDTTEFHTCYIYNPSISEEALAKLIAAELGVVVSPGDNFYHVIHERLLALSEEGKKIVLILDESQAMKNEGLEFIRLLTNLETESQKLLQVVIFAQPELLVRLKKKNMRQLAQRIVYHFQLKPLTLPECGYYLRNRISILGGDGDFIFPRATREKIWSIAKGNPRAINILAKRALLCAYARDGLSVNVKDVEEAKEEIRLSWESIATPIAKNRKRPWVMIGKWIIGGVCILVLAGEMTYLSPWKMKMLQIWSALF